MKRTFMILIGILMVVLAGCSGTELKEEQQGTKSDQFALGDISFAAPKNWTGKYEVVAEDKYVDVFHVCKESDDKEPLFKLVQVTKDEYKQELKENPAYKEGLLAQVGNAYYVATLPTETGYEDQQDCQKEYDDLSLSLAEIEARITIK